MEKEIDINIDLSKDGMINLESYNQALPIEKDAYQEILFKNMKPVARGWLIRLGSIGIDSSRLARGKKYFDEGRIRSIDIGYNVIMASIQGENGIYDVVINFDELTWDDKKLLYESVNSEDFMHKRIDSSLMEKVLPMKDNIKCACTCSDNVEKNIICKHIAASLIGVGYLLDISPLDIVKLRNLENEDIAHNNLLEKRNIPVETEFDIDVNLDRKFVDTKTTRSDKEIDIDIDVNKQKQEMLTDINKIPLPIDNKYTRIISVCLKQNNFNIDDTIAFLYKITDNNLTTIKSAIENYIDFITIKDLIDESLINRIDIIGEKYKKDLMIAIKNNDVNSPKHTVGLIKKSPKFSQKIQFIIELVDRRLVVISVDRNLPIFKYYTELLNI